MGHNYYLGLTCSPEIPSHQKSAAAPSSLQRPALLPSSYPREKLAEAERQAVACEVLLEDLEQDFPHFRQDFHSRSCRGRLTCHCPPGPRLLNARNPSWGKTDCHPGLQLTCCHCCDAPEATAMRAFSSLALLMGEVWRLGERGETTRPNGHQRSAGWSNLGQYKV